MANDPTDVPRWKLRLTNYTNAVDGVAEAVALSASRPLSELEKAGTIQRFEIAWELGWKLLADYLTDALAPPEEYTPTKTIRAAMSAGILHDGDGWIAAGRARNIVSHTYSEEARDRALQDIAARYLPLLAELRDTMKMRAA